MSNCRSGTSSSKLLKLISTPAKVLTKATDLYTSGQLSFGTVMGCPTAHFSTAPRARRSTAAPRHAVKPKTVSRSTSLKEYKEIKRISTGGDDQLGSSRPSFEQPPARSMGRSFSVGVIGRIDEDKPYYCEDDDHGDDELQAGGDVFLLRSSSCCFKINWHGPSS